MGLRPNLPVFALNQYSRVWNVDPGTFDKYTTCSPPRIEVAQGGYVCFRVSIFGFSRDHFGKICLFVMFVGAWNFSSAL